MIIVIDSAFFTIRTKYPHFTVSISNATNLIKKKIKQFAVLFSCSETLQCRWWMNHIGKTHGCWYFKLVEVYLSLAIIGHNFWSTCTLLSYLKFITTFLMTSVNLSYHRFLSIRIQMDTDLCIWVHLYFVGFTTLNHKNFKLG